MWHRSRGVSGGQGGAVQPMRDYLAYLLRRLRTEASLEVETRWRDPTREHWQGLFMSPIDTTFALYPACSDFHYAAVRTGAPCELLHLPWYEKPTEEDRFYLARASTDDHGSRWARRAR